MCKICQAIPIQSPAVRTVAVALIIVLLVVAAASLGKEARRLLTPNAITSTMAVRSSVDGATYLVHGDLEDPHRAADLLARLNQRATALVGSLRRRYFGTAGRPPALPAAKRTPARLACASNLINRYNPDNFVENSYKDSSGDSSYCIDKGAVLAICLRTRAGADEGAAGQFQDEETLFFVTLHELTHMTIREIDHPKRFWAAFRFILEEAEQVPAPFAYRSPDFERHPVTYCGVRVDYNPRYDQGVASIDSKF